MTEKLLYRHFELDSKSLSDEKNEMELSFSSELPVKRWYDGEIVDEILLHGKQNVDLARLKKVGSMIYGHMPDELKNILGPIKTVTVTPERTLRAKVGFDADENAQLAKNKVKSGSLRGVSFGYMITKVQQVTAKEKWTDPDSGNVYKGPAILGTKWTPFEISLTPVPADHTVGPNRDDLTRSLEGIEIEQSTKTIKQEVTEMDEKEIKQLIENAVVDLKIPSAEDIAESVRASLAEDARPKLMVSPEEYRDLTSRAGAVSPDCKLGVADMVGDGKNADEIKTYILDEATKPDAEDKQGRSILDEDGNELKTEGPVTSFKQIEDDNFFDGLSNPSAFALN